MSNTPRATSSSWELLRRNLKGYFTAHAHGILATEFALLGPDGQEFGRLRLDGASSAEFGSGGYTVSLEASDERYRMVSDSGEVLTAGRKGRSIDALEISCSGRIYEARVSLLRNSAVASYPGGGERAARLSGGLTGRSYEALFATEDRCALPVALFLLWHVVANRRRAFRTRSRRGGGTM